MRPSRASREVSRTVGSPIAASMRSAALAYIPGSLRHPSRYSCKLISTLLREETLSLKVSKTSAVITRSHDVAGQPSPHCKVPKGVSFGRLQLVAGWQGVNVNERTCSVSPQREQPHRPGPKQDRASAVCFHNPGVNQMRTAEQYGLDDSAVQAMGRAFDIACARLSRTGVMLPGNLDRMQKIAAQQLVMYARNGERNEWRLARRAIFAVCAAVAGERLASGLPM